jgi:hypothetical protein
MDEAKKINIKSIGDTCIIYKNKVLTGIFPKSFGTLFQGDYFSKKCLVLVHSKKRNDFKFLD